MLKKRIMANWDQKDGCLATASADAICGPLRMETVGQSIIANTKKTLKRMAWKPYNKRARLST